MSFTYTGIATMVIGTFVVNKLGLSDSCGGEITSKVIEYAPVVVGGIMATFGRLRIGARVAALRKQVSVLGGEVGGVVVGPNL